MPETPSRLVAPVLLGTSIANLYGPTPAATTQVLRNIHVTNVSAAPVTLFISMGASLVDTDTSRIFAVVIPAATVMDWSGFMVMPTGEYITGKASVASALSVNVSAMTVT